MKKKVVFITNSLGFGGAEKMLVFVANKLFERGFGCAIINLNTIPGYVNEHLQNIDRNVHVVTLDEVPRGKNKNIYRITKIIQIAKEFNADILVGFTGFPNIYARVAGFLLGVPSIISERGDPNRTKAENVLKETLSKLIINSSRGAVFQIPGAMSYYGKGLQKRGTVIPNPIYISEKIETINRDKKEKSVVSVGRFDNTQKRYDVMIKAFSIFSKKHPEYVLKLYGNGPDKESIEKWIEEEALSEKVLFKGVSSNPMRDIITDEIFLITSDFEGISNALLEAMAVGMPCVSTDHTPGGARFLIKDHENGLLAPVGNIAKIAEALCEFADSSELEEMCGDRARNVIKRFAPQKIIDMWENYIEEVCK